MVWDVVASAALPLLGGIFGPNIVGDTGTPGEDFTSGIDELRAIQIPGVAEQLVNWDDLVQQGYFNSFTSPRNTDGPVKA
jgi:hypothetical protein